MQKVWQRVPQDKKDSAGLSYCTDLMSHSDDQISSVWKVEHTPFLLRGDTLVLS